MLGSIGICVGAFGMLAGAQDIALPYLATIQMHALDRIAGALNEPADTESATAAATPKGPWSGMLRSLLSTPRWYQRYAMTMGIFRVVLGLACILASVGLLLIRAGADFHFMLSMGLSAARNLTAVGMGIAAGTLFSYWAVASGLVGFFLDSILVLVCVICDRRPYQFWGT
jgi:hypothetical protein